MMFGQFAFVLSNFYLFKHQKFSGINIRQNYSESNSLVWSYKRIYTPPELLIFEAEFILYYHMFMSKFSYSVEKITCQRSTSYKAH